ncbi:MAG: hypothetical protein F4197_14375 [Acidimicrobiia bacterium]|nr:hypothetical protein [Acidimicrobiia bacterium]
MTVAGRSSERVPPDRYLMPIAGLQVPCRWEIGRVALYPGTAGLDLIRDVPPIGDEGDFFHDGVYELLDSARESTIAVVPGRSDIDAAIDELRASLDVLRLFQLSRQSGHSTSFGLPGDVSESKIGYIAIWENSAPGHRLVGDYLGFTFTQASYDDWASSIAFQYLSDSIADTSPPDGARRAVTGARLLARAVTEYRSDLKMLSVMAALEAWLLNRHSGPQTLRLARHVTWFGCGRPGDNLCGRDRPICAYLYLSPNKSRDRGRLNSLRDLGNTHLGWRCSEWHQVMDWYDARSAAAHGALNSVDAKHASSAEYCVLHYLMEPILNWLREHPQEPVADLEEVIDAIEEPGGWEGMIEALDSELPPAMPPLP